MAQTKETAEVGDLSLDVQWPPTPFHQLTQGGLAAGKTLFIDGETKSGKSEIGDQFTVNFMLNDDDKENNNVAFHYDVRFWDSNSTGQAAIHMNSRLNGIWQEEERIANSFQKDRPFRISVQITSDALIISHNHNNAMPYTFRFRNKTTAEKVQKIFITGNIHIRRIFYGCPLSTPPPPAYTFTVGPMLGDTHVSSLTDSKSVPGGMYSGRQVVVRGVAGDGAKRFAIDLNDVAGNIVLHISSRFDERAVVRNSQQSGKWATEERQSSAAFPFQLGQPFQVQILSEPTKYRISINGQHYADFSHRADPLSVQSVQVKVTHELSSVNTQVY